MMTAATKPDALVFDLDGTLFQTETLSLPAYHQAFDRLREGGLYSGPTPPQERFLSSLGLLLEEIWKRVLPEATEDVRTRLNDLLLECQIELLKEGVGQLYPGVEKTLQALRKQGCRLFVASNGLEDYVKEVVHYQGIGHLFEGLYSAGEFQTRTKVDLVKRLRTTFGLVNPWMVGDRSSDVEAGLGNDMFVVGCDYGGFSSANELDGAHAVITHFDELTLLVENSGKTTK